MSKKFHNIKIEWLIWKEFLLMYLNTMDLKDIFLTRAFLEYAALVRIMTVRIYNRIMQTKFL